jgi:hypothetical protein
VEEKQQKIVEVSVQTLKPQFKVQLMWSKETKDCRSFNLNREATILLNRIERKGGEGRERESIADMNEALTCTQPPPRAPPPSNLFAKST